MKFQGFLATAAAAMVCCVTLGCPPAENSEEVPVEVDVVAPTDGGNTTTAPAPATPPAEGEVEPVGEDVVEIEEPAAAE